MVSDPGIAMYSCKCSRPQRMPPLFAEWLLPTFLQVRETSLVAAFLPAQPEITCRFGEVEADCVDAPPNGGASGNRMKWSRGGTGPFDS